jgi:hypothetical protein
MAVGNTVTIRNNNRYRCAREFCFVYVAMIFIYLFIYNIIIECSKAFQLNAVVTNEQSLVLHEASDEVGRTMDNW